MNHWLWPVSLVGILSTAVACGTDMFFLLHSVAKRCVAAGARTRSSLARYSSTGWDRVAIRWPTRLPAGHFVSACADAPTDADATTSRADRAVPCWASRSPETVSPPTTSESTRHRVDHVFACGVPWHESLWHPRLGIRSLILPAGSETTASAQSLRCPPEPGVEAGHKTPALPGLRASTCDSRLLRSRCRASPTSAGERVNHIL